MKPRGPGEPMRWIPPRTERGLRPAHLGSKHDVYWETSVLPFIFEIICQELRFVIKL